MSKELSKNQGVIYQIESFLDENYEFRRNVLSGKTEVRKLSVNADEWRILTTEALNSIIRKAKKEGLDEKSPRTDIEEYIGSDDIKTFDPIKDYLENLPSWDGRNHVADLFNRIPGLTSEQLHWCSTWLRSAVAHWLGMDMLHGNECVPVLIGTQGCGKTTFAVRLLPEHLREYFLDHINFGNKFDSDMALTHNLLVNIDEFANMKESQQAKLKQILSRVKVNGRPIFGKSQEDRRRYASFLATTNDEHPLCDVTGSRRYLCLQIPKGLYIDNESPIDYQQLYAQLLYELREQQTPYWFTNEEVKRIQQVNAPFFKQVDLERMIESSFKVPSSEEQGHWMLCKDVIESLQQQYPMLEGGMYTKVRVGKILKFMGFDSQHSKHGQKYLLVPRKAA
ncbi:MAG: DUF3874 domain-containing protein [Bacteroidaceae bacterium]|nr:DUF3874 domain-containing protein [Bacteroidaceae bacterium]